MLVYRIATGEGELGARYCVTCAGDLAVVPAGTYLLPLLEAVLLKQHQQSGKNMQGL